MKIVSMNKGGWGYIVAFFDLVTEEGFTIKGFKIVKSKVTKADEGLFVGYPSQKGSDGEYYDNVYADKDLKARVMDIALKEYNNPSEKQQNQEAPEEIPF